MNTKTKTQTKTALAELEASYESILLAEKELSAKKEAIKATVMAQFDKQNGDSYGRFKISTRRSFHWEVDVLKTIFGDAWTSFVVADDKTLRAKAETMPILLSNAAVTETQALVFSK